MNISHMVHSVVTSAKNKMTSMKASVQSNLNGEHIVWMNPDDLKIDPARKAFYPQRQETVDDLTKSMENVGFDNSQPLTADQNKVTLDGHSRIMAIHWYNQLHPDHPILSVPVMVKHIDNEDEALDLIMRIQTKRRQLDDGYRFGAFHKLDAIKEERKHRGESTEKYSDVALAEKIGVSERMISKMRYVLRNATPEQIQQIENNQLGINEVYVKIQNALGKANSSPKKDSSSVPAATLSPSSASENASVPANTDAPVKKNATPVTQQPPSPSSGTSILMLIKFVLLNERINNDVPDLANKLMNAAKMNWSNIDNEGFIIDISTADSCGLKQLVART